MAERSLTGVENGSGGLVDDLARLLGAAARSWRLVLLAIVVCLTAAAVYLARKPAVYQATARLLILQRSQNPLARPQDAIGAAGEAIADSMPTQALLIRSPLIVGRALELAKLKDLAPGAVVGGLVVSRPDPTAKILQVNYASAEPEAAKAVVAGVLQSYGAFLDEHYHEKNGDAAKLLVRARDELNDELKAVEREYLELHRRSNAEGGGEEGEAAQARRLALWDQAAGEARLRAIRLREQLELGRSLSREGADLWAVVHAMAQLGAGAPATARDGGGASRSGAADELARLGLRRIAAERALENLALARTGPGSGPESPDAEVDRLLAADPELEELDDALDVARGRFAEARRRARRPSEAAARLAADRVAALEAARVELVERLRPAILRKLSEGALGDPEAGRIKSELATIRAQEAALRERLSGMDATLLKKLRRAEADLVARGPEDAPDLASLRARIAGLEGGDAEPASDEAAIRDLLDSTERSLASVESMQAEIQKQFARGVDESKRSETDRLALDNARNNLDRRRQFYNTVVDQLKHVHLSDDFRAVSAQVIDPPTVSAVRPNAMLVIAVAGSVGLALGLGLAAVSERIDPRLRSVEEIRRAVGLPMLGIIPRMPPSLPTTRGNLGLIGLHMPRSPMAEVLRIVRTGLDHRRRGRSPRVILVTSPVPGDGKTVTASNLAISLAEAGRRVLVIDADMRSPRFDAMYELSRGPGLSDVLGAGASIREVARPSPIAGLAVVTSGEDARNPAELLSSPRFREALDEAREAYDVVVIDSPPLLAVADAGIIGGEVDGILLVVRASTLRLQEAERTMEILEAIGTPPLGMVINRPEGRDDRRAYGAYFAYGTYGEEGPGRRGRASVEMDSRDVPTLKTRKSG